MKKTILLMGMAFIFGTSALQAQTSSAKKATTTKKAAPTEEELKKIFDERFAEILNLVTVASKDSAAGVATGLFGTKKEFGVYPVNKGKSLPYTSQEEYTFYSRWEYRAEFGKFKPGQEAEQQAMEEKITKLVQDNISKTDWKQVTTTGKNDEKTKELLHYNNLKGMNHIRLKVSKRSSGNVIILTWN
jgi:hypothetical protein